MSRYLIAVCLATVAAAQPGRGVNFYSLEKEVALGRQLADEFMRENPVVESPAVVEYVLHLPLAEMAVDGRVVEPGALGGPGDLEVAGIVLHQDGDVVAVAEAAAPEEVGEAVRALIEPGEGDHLT